MIITDKSKLCRKCENVSLFESQGIIEKLIDELNEHPTGAGLAAIQIGIYKKVAIVRIKELIVLVNPIIIEMSDLREFEHEGCLSFPGQFITTKRYNEIFIKDDIHPFGIVCTGFEGVAVQHEIGHLDGETMFDYEIRIPKINDICWCGDKKYKKCHRGSTISRTIL
jgi:peptide deformylase